jgi:ectoine hydroxylase-related dioxygenase (phytanoyl-CoA dioxygenase family)
MSSLIDDHRIDGVASGILGEDYNYVISDGNFYVGDTQWHSDYRIAKPSIKAAFYLDEVTADTGALRVIPGSQKIDDTFSNTLHEMMPTQRESHTEEPLGVYGDQIPAVALESKPGDLVCFDRRIKHASFGGGTRRRMFTMVFEPHGEDETDMAAIRRHIGQLSIFWCERAYGEVMINTASPQRMVHLQQRLANDGHLPELTRKAKLEMDEPQRG